MERVLKDFSMSFYKKLGLVVISAALTACGGGGGDSSSPAPVAPTTFPIEAAVSGILTSSSAFTTNYTDPDNGDIYTLSYGYTPSGDVTFEGMPAKTGVSTLNFKLNGAFYGASTSTSYFQLSPVKSLGGTGTGVYVVAGTQTAYPTTAKVGDLGNTGTSTVYTDSTKSKISATGISTWELAAADSATTAYFCFNNTIKYTNGNPDANVSQCYKIDTKGVVVGNKITMTINGEVVKFVN
jgi:hypothetical protein